MQVVGVGLTNGPGGVYFKLNGNGSWSVGPSIVVDRKHQSWGAGVATGVNVGKWHGMALAVTEHGATGRIDGALVFEQVNTHRTGLRGWVGIGASDFGPVQYDRFEMHSV